MARPKFDSDDEENPGIKPGSDRHKDRVVPAERCTARVKVIDHETGAVSYRRCKNLARRAAGSSTGSLDADAGEVRCKAHTRMAGKRSSEDRVAALRQIDDILRTTGYALAEMREKAATELLPKAYARLDEMLDSGSEVTRMRAVEAAAKWAALTDAVAAAPSMTVIAAAGAQVNIGGPSPSDVIKERLDRLAAGMTERERRDVIQGEVVPTEELAG